MSPGAYLIAGDTWSWTASVQDYPAGDGWALTYVFTNADQRFTVVSTADGNDHALTMTAANSSAIIPGRYGWTAFAKKSAQRFQVGTGTVQIRPNVEGNKPFDTRSDARIIYDGLMALWKSHSTGQALAASYTIAGRAMAFKTSADLIKELQFWKMQVEAEEIDEKLRSGEQAGQKLYFRLER